MFMLISIMAMEIEKIVLTATRATQCWESEVLQSLWSGYGSILRYYLEDAEQKSVIVKHVSPPSSANHPRGWNTNLSHQRKLKSYQVESAWYEHYAKLCGSDCRVPECFVVEREEDNVIILLEDLDASGFGVRRSSVGKTELHTCLRWLAEFHASFLETPTEGLWECGTYWHLDTRPDELKKLATEDLKLFQAAHAIDAQLKASPYQTIVHGDAKLANFCFSADGSKVAAVDFQYVGRGCGMKDVAYFIGSCLGDEECEQQSSTLLDHYFTFLRVALTKRNRSINIDDLEKNWRSLYPVAWTDFHRFLKGWSPGHWKIHSYSERLAKEVLAQI